MASGIIHLWWNKTEACRVRSIHIGGALARQPIDFERTPINCRCKRCEKRAVKLRKAFPHRFVETVIQDSEDSSI